ncbi:MAG: N-acetylmuramoyl-L-alanine amidase family protein [Candidatus Bipolaricaulaceae bacterium]
MARFACLALATAACLLAVTISGGYAGLPEAARRFTVMVDAGHGGQDPGAQVAGVDEKDVNLAIVFRLASLARDYPALRVVLTRASDRYVDLRARVQLAERVGAVLYLSIHANACSDPQVCGVETWVDDERDSTDPSWELARAVQRQVCAHVGAADRGVHAQRLYMRHTDLPAALLEVGYLTCPAERRRLVDPAYQEELARAALAGILAFLGL